MFIVEVVTGSSEPCLDGPPGSDRVGGTGQGADPDIHPNEDVHERALAQTRDALFAAPKPRGRSTDYERGFTAAIRYARVCVLDRMSSGTVDFIEDLHPYDLRMDRERLRTSVALRSIGSRLLQELRADPEDEVAAGYRRGIVVALGVIADQESALQQNPVSAAEPRERSAVSLC